MYLGREIVGGLFFKGVYLFFSGEKGAFFFELFCRFGCYTRFFFGIGYIFEVRVGFFREGFFGRSEGFFKESFYFRSWSGVVFIFRFRSFFC